MRMSPAVDDSSARPGAADDAMAPQADVIRYRERLGAPVWAWLVMFGLVICLAVAFWVPLGTTAGVLAFVLGASLVTWLLVTTSATIVVTQREIRVNRAHIDVDDVGLVATLDEASTAGARGPNADPRAFTVIRPLTAKESISLEILDEEDPHPYWLISTRRPQELGGAIRAAQQSAATGAPPPQ